MSQRRQNSASAFSGSLVPIKLIWSCAALSLLAGSTVGLAQSAVRDPMGETAGGEEVKVDDNGLVDLHVVNGELGTILNWLSTQTQKNIITSKNVSATFTGDLYQVDFYEALEAILHPNGYTYEEKGNFIYVYTIEEYDEIQRQTRPVVTRIFYLNYLNASDAAEFAALALSDTGQIKANGPTDKFEVGTTPVGSDSFAQSAVLVVNDYEENVAEIEKLLNQLDTRPSQVLVEATIVETSITEDNAFGVDFSILGELDFADFVGLGGPLKATEGLISGKGVRIDAAGSEQDVSLIVPGGTQSGGTSTVGNTTDRGGFKAGLVTGDVAVFLKVLDEVSDTTILSRPKILTLNRQPARVLVGRKVGYISTTATDTSTTQTVEFLDTGTQLYFRPFISNDGMIRMELKPQVSEAIIRNATDANNAVVTIPDEITNELTTNIMVRDGQTVVLGGLFKEKTQIARRQVPFVGDLPIIGSAFRGRDDSVARSEIIFMITPTILSDEVAGAMGEVASEWTDNVQAGAREGLLWWSREKRTNQLNVEAERAYRAGKLGQALYKNRMSLHLSPDQPDAVRFREKLLEEQGKTAPQWQDRSALDVIIKREAIDRVGEMSLYQPPEPDSPAVPLEGQGAPEPAQTAQVSEPQASAAPAHDQKFTDDAPPAKEPAVAQAEPVLLNLHASGMDLVTVLNWLGVQSDHEMVITPNVSGTFTGAIENATFEDALAQVLDGGRFEFRIKGDAAFVFPTKAEPKVTMAQAQPKANAVAPRRPAPAPSPSESSSTPIVSTLQEGAFDQYVDQMFSWWMLPSEPSFVEATPNPVSTQTETAAVEPSFQNQNSSRVTILQSTAVTSLPFVHVGVDSIWNDFVTLTRALDPDTGLDGQAVSEVSEGSPE